MDSDWLSMFSSAGKKTFLCVVEWTAILLNVERYLKLYLYRYGCPWCEQTFKTMSTLIKKSFTFQKFLIRSEMSENT